MTRAKHAARRLFLALLLVVGCGSIGKETRFPYPVTTSGVGPFRQLGNEETGVAGSPEGRAVNARGHAIDNGMVAGDRLFYAAGAFEETVPDRAGDVPEFDVDWGQFQARGIFRGAPSSELLGFSEGTVVFEAAEPWEGEEVTDPWVVVLPDGRARLYYAARDGIGVAEAPSVDGAFARVGDGPVVGAASDIGDGSAPRSPTVVADPTRDGWLMYFDAGDGVQVARSDDGLAFTTVDADPTSPGVDPIFTDVPLPEADDEEVEVGVRMPGALVARTPAGRTLVRVYFEVLYDDGTTFVSMAASEDGVTFERYQGQSFAVDNAGAPRPLLADGGLTLLYATVDAREQRQQVQGLVIGVTPADHRFVDPPADPME